MVVEQRDTANVPRGGAWHLDHLVELGMPARVLQRGTQERVDLHAQTRVSLAHTKPLIHSRSRYQRAGQSSERRYDDHGDLRSIECVSSKQRCSAVRDANRQSASHRGQQSDQGHSAIGSTRYRA